MWSFHWWFCIVKFWVKWRSVKECKLASADWHLQVCILSQRELTNLDKNLWAIIWPEKVILKEWQQEQQQTAKTTTIVSLRYRKKQSIVCQICGKRYFRMVFGTFFQKNGHFLVLDGSVLFLTSPTVQCLRQHCIRQQDPNNYSDTVTRVLSSLAHNSPLFGKNEFQIGHWRNIKPCHISWTWMEIQKFSPNHWI